MNVQKILNSAAHSLMHTMRSVDSWTSEGHSFDTHMTAGHSADKLECAIPVILWCHRRDSMKGIDLCFITWFFDPNGMHRFLAHRNSPFKNFVWIQRLERKGDVALCDSIDYAPLIFMHHSAALLVHMRTDDKNLQHYYTAMIGCIKNLKFT